VQTFSATLPEEEAASIIEPIGLLTYVLFYDDLLTDRAARLPPLTRARPALELRRAAGEGPSRFEGAALLIPDPYMSGRHALVARRDGGEDAIEDLGSTHGTFVNGEAVNGSRALRDGDLIEVGRSLLCYRRLDARLLIQAGEGGVEMGPTRTLCPELAATVLDLNRVAPTDQPILVLAETGAGKEIAARHVHEKSGRSGPFVAIDCGAIPGHLVESELFGHRKGAFSGASEERKGRIRSAEGGTVFLDEIGNMPEQAQASLLRVIQEREVTPVGADSGRKVDVRWVSATNADIFAENARFRSDLRARLAGYVARLPPLRARREDLGILSAHLLAKGGLTRAAMSKQAARQLFASELSGNVRELERTLARAAVLAGGERIEARHLGSMPGEARADVGEAPKVEAIAPDPASDKPGTGRRKRPEREQIINALERAGGVQGQAARLLGVHERQLARWMDALGIPRARGYK
jgi:sigma-54 dependent transcriptional regulator, acetoin dehydrogenase operon transcriptional activator AcoR